MNPYYNESAFLQDLAILVNTDSGTGTAEAIPLSSAKSGASHAHANEVRDEGASS